MLYDTQPVSPTTHPSMVASKNIPWQDEILQTEATPAVLWSGKFGNLSSFQGERFGADLVLIIMSYGPVQTLSTIVAAVAETATPPNLCLGQPRKISFGRHVVVAEEVAQMIGRRSTGVHRIRTIVLCNERASHDY